MSGSGMIAAQREIPVRTSVALEREACAAALDARAEEIERRVNPGALQAHSRKLPTEGELAEAAFACRQLRIAAGDLRAGLHALSELDAGEGPQPCRLPYPFRDHRTLAQVDGAGVAA